MEPQVAFGHSAYHSNRNPKKHTEQCNFGDTKRKYFKDEPITYWHAWEASWSVWKPKMSLSCSHSLGLVLSPRPSCPFILSSTFLSDLQELI